MISGTATTPNYGTSEPALNTTVVALGETRTTSSNHMSSTAAESIQCTTVPTPVIPPTPPAPKPEVLRLQVPRNVHYGLDEDFISSESTVVLGKIADDSC